MKPENAFFYFELYKDIRYGDTYRGVIKLLQKTLLNSSGSGEIRHFDIELNFENGIGTININEEDYMYDPFGNPSYKIRIDIPNKGLTPQEFKEFKEKAERHIRERNNPNPDIKNFKDKVIEMPSSSNTFDYNDVPSSGGGGGGGGKDFNRRKTAIV